VQFSYTPTPRPKPKPVPKPRPRIRTGQNDDRPCLFNFRYADISPYWVYVIQCCTLNRIHVGMTSDLPRRIEEHRTRRSGSPATTRHGVSEIIETLPVPTREEAFVVERATVLGYLREGRCIVTGGGIGERKAIQARDEHNLMKCGLTVTRKRSVWNRRPRLPRLPLELRRRVRRQKRMASNTPGAGPQLA
jgi:predicted GIY-YIG superfamily endonuclease